MREDTGFERYQVSAISCMNARVSYFDVVGWCEDNIPADRWCFMGHNDLVIGFLLESDWVWCKMVWL